MTKGLYELSAIVPVALMNRRPCGGCWASKTQLA
jgi:hypothetical protein